MRPEQSKPKIILFDHGHLMQTLLGDKQITLRKYRPEAHSLKKGDIFIGSFRDGVAQRGLDVPLEATAATLVKPFDELTNKEAQEDGFVDANDAFTHMLTYYPDLTSTTSLAVVRYRIARIQGIPAIRLNNFYA